MKLNRTWIYSIAAITLALTLILGGAFVAQAATATPDTATLQQPGRGGRGGGGNPGNPSNPVTPSLPPVSTLDAQETEDLLWMREEEKVARDVYLTLSDEWNLTVFANISRSEQQHMDALLTLLNRYGIEDPVIDTVGVFTNPDLQALYNDLVAQGLTSQEAALGVGALIEEVDILDLEEAIANTDNADVLQVYQDLECGSNNHLRSFVGMLESTTGQTYTPQYLDQTTYDAIMDGSQGNCGQSAPRRSGRHGRNSTPTYTW